MALLCRLICFPIETYFVSDAIDTTSATKNKYEMERLLWVLLRASQTLPDMALASAFGLLIVFCAQVALLLSPHPTDGSMGTDDNTETVGNGTPPQATRDNDLNKQQSATNNGDTDGLKSNPIQTLFELCAKCVRKTLTSKMAFVMWNATLVISFLAIFFVALVIPTRSPENFEICLWFVLVGVYSLLSLVLIFTGGILMKALQPGMLQRKGANALALRLIGMCILLAWMFLDRLVSFGIAARKASVSMTNEVESVRTGQYVSLAAYRKNAISYAFFEVLPVLFILLIMHRKKKDPAANGQNDVLITNSIMTNIFGRSTRQEPALIHPAPSSGSSNKGGGGLGSRRFQTYHGSTSRADSFPSKSTKQQSSKETSPLLPK